MPTRMYNKFRMLIESSLYESKVRGPLLRYMWYRCHMQSCKSQPDMSLRIKIHWKSILTVHPYT